LGRKQERWKGKRRQEKRKGRREDRRKEVRTEGIGGEEKRGRKGR